MGTKNNPGNYDCYANAADDEPMFVLLARDPAAAETVRFWIAERTRLGKNDIDQLDEAHNCADQMDAWFETHHTEGEKSA